jgi:predicted enzyme related to lactoylglutathione lyase
METVQNENITIVMEEPAPVIVEEPIPEPEAVIVEEPMPEPAPVVVEEPAPVVVEEPAHVIVEEPMPEPVVEEPAPVIVEEPMPEPVVEEPAPVIIEEPMPVIVEEPAPVIVEEPAPVIVEEPAPVIVEEPAPVVVEEPAPVIVEEPAPVIVEEPAPVVVEEPMPEPDVEEPAQVVEESNNNIPKLVFIVPYRDREQQQKFFSQQMKVVLEDMKPEEYKIYYIHQTDKREFNRGAMKNIGFLAVKQKYPEHYKNITLVFNDVDTMPYTKNFLNYETTKGVVKHFYGFTYALGGIVSIKAGDFEKVGGFPNFWAWGYEDNLINKRVLNNKLTIDRTQFYNVMDKNIFQMKDGLSRLVNRGEFDRYLSETTEGWHSIQSLEYNINEETGFVDVTNFYTGIVSNPKENKIHDLRNGSRPFGGLLNMNTKRRNPRFSMTM